MDFGETAELILRNVAAVACGAILGWEREWHNKPAGLRTHMLVALGAATFVSASYGLSARDPAAASLDPLRAVAGVVGGIGFLGAGAIIRDRGGVRGITTAATIWVVGAIGITCGVGLYVIALSTTVLAFIILSVFGKLEMALATSTKTADKPPGSPDESV